MALSAATFLCEACLYTWEVAGHHEYGGATEKFFEPLDPLANSECPDCGADDISMA